MFKIFLVITSLAGFLMAQTAEEFRKEQMSGFDSYKTTQEAAFKKYQKDQMKAFADYKKEVGALWSEPKMSTKKAWVSYTKDKKTRTDVDFSKETITVETIASSPQEARTKLKIALAKAVTVDTKTVQETDPLEVKLDALKKPSGVVDGKVKAEPILSTVIFKKPPTKKSVFIYVKKNITDEKMKVVKSDKVKHKKVYSIQVKMPSNAMVKRSEVYKNVIMKNAKKQKLPVSLVFAIMHSESNFNPRARSHVPAFGLMQIVPKTAGIDAYNFLYKKKKLVTGQYLYDSTQNITMGTAYLHILYFKYLRKIKDPKSRMYCTIAAYNTGSGNIAWAFTKKYNMNKAAPLINEMSAEQVYKKLRKDLRWPEAQNYLKKVSTRMTSYHKIYGS
ncbi:murein transglycosylase domain-containing protein [Sulfurimonas sp.]|uniref:murein transglycosylase domain-containing protein n=1 Tax=Sulfurimonas sp. TaxID=2022749 RepID=UPI0025E366F1|nr:murein transglycosylase domain-containing protein [Sulfurimonas sp.]